MDEPQKHTALVAGAIVLALLSILAGAVIATSDDDAGRAAPSPSPSTKSSPTPEPTPSETSSASPEPSEGGESSILEDGHHFVYVTDAARRKDGSVRVTFDLAYFLTGEAGERAAAEHGDEFVNDYYIVNDNPRLRTLSLGEDVGVRYIPAGGCCELQPGSVDAWLEAVLETNPTDYAGKDVPWWFTVKGGAITKIAQRYLP